jgi:hypothetical protein
MIIIKNNLIPFNGFWAMTIYPFIFCRSKIDETTLNHEKIHAKQQLELILIVFYLIYLIEWIFRGYRNISFEKEAYNNEKDFNYLKKRKLFGMWKK